MKKQEDEKFLMSTEGVNVEIFIMARSKHLSRKLRLAKSGKQTRWAPFWTVPKKYGKGRKVHPGRMTVVKRNWRRVKLKA